MSQTANLQIVVLFEDELRAAASALKSFEACTNAKGDVDKDAYTANLTDALQACWAALFHLTLITDPDSQVMVAKKSMFKKGK